MRVTIRDVAQRAGVSVSTASRALSGARPVGTELTTRVTAAARALGYRQNRLASALRTQRTGTVGMVVPQISNPFFPALVEAIERSLSGSGRQLLLCDAQRDPAVEAVRLQALADRQVDGLIVAPVSAVASADALAAVAAEVPVVQVDRYVTDADLDWVGVDDAAGLRLIAGHLADVGARTVVLVSAGSESSTGRSRLAGFGPAAARHRLTTAEPLLGEYGIDWGVRAADLLRARGPLPDAIVGGNDEIALGVVRGLRAAGVRVPDDVLVTGFDDAGFAALADPALTTVRQPHALIADECVRLLDLARAGGEQAPRRIALAPTLVVRASTTRS
ncbi:LacI family DNA-binding transcriptional regulator [Actinocatenispora rupis]|uniref:LacI family transcriptional regulator n=1 Tax=Actinocatenispora rupis TaxID=519421 RepID=A0A8J3J2B8_9ACTN|nr:LacI family DNA-binding transcriptional regulator [Actinocatenispora rupis]GID14471.1 LacI family transcriptional regulator [Actinocatenispora rupis]